MRPTDRILIPALVPAGIVLSMLLEAAYSGEAVTLLEYMGFFAVNALYLGAPHLLLGVLALWRQGVRRHAVPALWCLSLYLLAFHIWVTSQFAPRDAAFIWLAYLPGSLVVVLLYWAFHGRTKP